MKCPICGGEIGDNRVCGYCGSQITPEMLREQELFNKTGCPRCGSTNVSFRRENQGEVKGKKRNKIIHLTVGLCKDCGYTWEPQKYEKKKNIDWKKVGKIALWVLGWLYVFPLPLTILLLRKKEMKPAVKYTIIAVAWILYLFIVVGLGGDRSEKSSGETIDSEKAVQSNDEKETETETVPAEKTSGPQVTEEDHNLTFVLSWNEPGVFGKIRTFNAGTDMEMTYCLFYVPAGVYHVRNLSTKSFSQVTVYSGVEFDGQWEQFLDDDCDAPIVVSPNEAAKTIEVKEGQFVKLSDGSTDIEFVLQDQ